MHLSSTLRVAVRFLRERGNRLQPPTVTKGARMRDVADKVPKCWPVNSTNISRG